jgi:hypothetical protein
MANEFTKQFCNVFIIINIYYEIVNKKVKTLGFDKYIHFYTFVAKSYRCFKKIPSFHTDESCSLHILTKKQ